MLPSVLMNVDFAASDASGATPIATRTKGAFLLVGTGCWIVPLLVAVLLGVR